MDHGLVESCETNVSEAMQCSRKSQEATGQCSSPILLRSVRAQGGSAESPAWTRAGSHAPVVGLGRRNQSASDRITFTIINIYK
jgi:hypothetical protein